MKKVAGKLPPHQQKEVRRFAEELKEMLVRVPADSYLLGSPRKVACTVVKQALKAHESGVPASVLEEVIAAIHDIVDRSWYDILAPQ